MWMFNLSSNQVTWLSGSATNTNLRGAYGIKGIFSPTNVPGSRNGHRMVSHPTMNALFVFGGTGYAQSHTFGGLKMD
jgi:hypothetical protein